VPQLAKLSRKTPPFLEQARSLASCFNNVIIPWSEDEVDGGPSYPHPAYGPVYKETAYGLVGIGGESRSQDANGQYIRVSAGGGTNTIETVGQFGKTLAGLTQFPLQGAAPAPATVKTPFRPGAPCENQDPPDLRTNLAPAPTQAPAPTTAGTEASGEVGRIVDSSQQVLDQLGAYGEALDAAGADESEGSADASVADDVKPEEKALQQSLESFNEKYGSGN
jgi:hypothetical protein